MANTVGNRSGMADPNTTKQPEKKWHGTARYWNSNTTTLDRYDVVAGLELKHMTKTFGEHDTAVTRTQRPSLDIAGERESYSNNKDGKDFKSQMANDETWK
ncbi:hypothetical protein HN51_034864 [Arachis hypogaea]